MDGRGFADREWGIRLLELGAYVPEPRRNGQPARPARARRRLAGGSESQGARAAYHRHPWALCVPISTQPLGPNIVAWMDDGLRYLAHTPLTEQQKMSSVLLSGFVRNEATLSADLLAASGGELDGIAVLVDRLAAS